MADSDDDSSSPHYAYNPGTQVVIMEGTLKKRGATMPVMRDRYCVATWEQDPAADGQHKAVVLRTYKTQASYSKTPSKPVSVHTLKCISEWSGKGNFHKYAHGFVMETTDKKLFHCAAPTDDDKSKWIELMSTVSTPRTIVEEPQSQQSQRDVRPTGEPLFGSDSSDDGHVDRRQLADPNEIHDAENELFSTGDDEEYYDEDEASYSNDDELDASGTLLSPPDEKLLFRAESSESLTASLDGDHRKHDEPDDWGIYGESNGHDGRSRYDVVDADPGLLLDKELLNGSQKGAAAPMASDDFLFERTGPTFGAVVVPRSNVDADDEFVDPRAQERMERKQKEKQRQRVAKKLESNRDLYAEMAAARLNNMRKDAKTKPRRSMSRRRSDLDSDDDEVWTSDEEDDHVDSRHSSSFHRGQSMNGSESRPSSSPSLVVSETPKSAVAFELEEVDSEDEMLRRRKSERRKSKEKKRAMVMAEAEAEAEAGAAQQEADEASQGFFDDDLLFGEASAPVGDVNAGEAVDQEEDDDEASRRRKETKKKKRQQRAEEEARLEEEARVAAAQYIAAEQPAAVAESVDVDSEEQRRLDKQRRKEERRARKERERREAEEAAQAEELARQHREAMLRMEEDKAKQERRERKERKKTKEKLSLDKKAKELKKKEAELAAEAEKLKQTQEALAKADESKDSRKKKRRDKYTSPADRIQRREKEAEALSSEMSSALVVVEQPAPVAPVAAPAAVVVETAAASAEAPSQSAPVSEPAPAVAAPVVVAAAAPVPTAAPEVAAPPLSAPAASSTPAPAQQQAAEPVVPPAPQSAPAQFPMGMPPQGYYPGYPPPPQGYQMPYPYAAPYPAVHYNPGFAPVPYGPGIAMPTPYYPHLGYVGGIAPMAPMSAGYGMMQPPSMQTAPQPDTSDENAFIGPQLPSPKSFPAASASAGPAPASPPPPPAAPVAAPVKSSMVLPDLPDVAEF